MSNLDEEGVCLECSEPLRRTPGGLLTCDTDWCGGNLATRSRLPRRTPVAHEPEEDGAADAR